MEPSKMEPSSGRDVPMQSVGKGKAKGGKERAVDGADKSSILESGAPGRPGGPADFLDEDTPLDDLPYRPSQIPSRMTARRRMICGCGGLLLFIVGVTLAGVCGGGGCGDGGAGKAQGTPAAPPPPGGMVAGSTSTPPPPPPSATTTTTPPKVINSSRDTAVIVELQSERQKTGTRAQDPTLRYAIKQEIPHDTNAFTQGFEYVDTSDTFLEGTGRWGMSQLRELEIDTGNLIRSQDIDRQYFGEGITRFRGKVYQIVWQRHTCFVYDEVTWQLLNTFSYTTQGWGLTHDDEHLIMSDGTNNIYFRDPDTFEEVRRIPVLMVNGGPVRMLNELEYVRGEIWANIWMQTTIVRIDPTSGLVLGYIDLGTLHPNGRPTGEDVLNGIAWDKVHDRLWLTGKLWPKVFQVEIVKR